MRQPNDDTNHPETQAVAHLGESVRLLRIAARNASGKRAEELEDQANILASFVPVVERGAA